MDRREQKKFDLKINIVLGARDAKEGPRRVQGGSKEGPKEGARRFLAPPGRNQTEKRERRR